MASSVILPNPNFDIGHCLICESQCKEDGKFIFSVTGKKLLAAIAVERYFNCTLQKSASTNGGLHVICRSCHRKITARNDEKQVLSAKIFPSLSTLRLPLKRKDGPVPSEPAKRLETEKTPPGSAFFENSTLVRGELHLHYEKGSSAANDVEVRKIILKEDEIGIVSSIARGSHDAAARKIISHPSIGQKIKDRIFSTVVTEIQSYSTRSNPNILRKVDKGSLKAFSWAILEDELRETTPTFIRFLQASSSPPYRSTSNGRLSAPVLSAACKLLSVYNGEMKALRYINSIIIKTGGMKKSGFKRLCKMNDCMSYDTTNQFLTKFGEGHDDKVVQWKEEVRISRKHELQCITTIDQCSNQMTLSELDQKEMNNAILLKADAEEELRKFQKHAHPGFCISGDNVDIRAKPRHMTVENQNKDHHWFQMNAYKNRISSNHLSHSSPFNDVKTIQLSSFLPGVETNRTVMNHLIVLVGHIWASYIPSLACMKQYLPEHIHHEFKKEVKQKTEKVHLGVYMKNETKNDDMIDLCKVMQEYVPTDDGVPLTRIAARGDQLTEEREKEALHIMMNARAGKRLSGLIPVLEDFHAQAQHLEVAWDILFSGSSSTDVGTLFHAKQALHSKNVTKHPSDNFYASQDLLKSFTEAYIIAGAMHMFNISDIDQDVDIFDGIEDENKKSHVEKLLREFLTRHTVSNPVLLDPTGEVSLDSTHCPLCGKKYKRRAAYLRHLKDVHDTTHETERNIDSSTSKQKQDHIYNYTCTVLKLCLMISDFDDAVAHGDGFRILELDKIWVMLFKLTHHTKYSHDTFEYLSQVLCLLPQRYAHSIMWNRSVNTQGKEDTNYPIDLDVEHDNRNFKDQFHTHHGDASQKLVDRVSRCVDTVCTVMNNFDKTSSIKKASGRHREKSSRERDVKALAKDYVKAKLFDVIPGRKHKDFPLIKADPLENVDLCDLQKWMKKLLGKFSKKCYYKI